MQHVIDKLRVLIIDDAKFVREKMKEILDNHYIVDLAASREDAFKKLQLAFKQMFKYDVVILDNYLPEPDAGLQVLRFIIEHQIDTIALMISGHTEIESEPFKTAIKAFQAGAVDFLAKPFPKNMLLDRLNQLIAKKKAALALIEMANEFNFTSYKEQLNTLLHDEEIDILTKERIRRLFSTGDNAIEQMDTAAAFLDEARNIEVQDSPSKSHSSMWNKRIRNLQDIPEKPRNDIFRIIVAHKQVNKIRFGRIGIGGNRTEYKIKIRPPATGSGQLNCTLYGPSPINSTRQNFIIFVNTGTEAKVKRDIESKIPGFCL